MPSLNALTLSATSLPLGAPAGTVVAVIGGASLAFGYTRSRNVVKNHLTGAYTFTVTRGGDLSEEVDAPWHIDPSSLPGRIPTTADYFSATSGTIHFDAGTQRP